MLRTGSFAVTSIVATLSLAVPVADADPAAELALGEANLELLPRAHLEDEKQVEPYVRATAFAQLVGGGEGGGDAGVGAAVGIGGIGCDLVNVAAQGRLRPLADSVAVGDARYSFCLSKLLLSVTFDGRRGVGLAPALSARSSLWRRRYSSEFDRVSIAFGEMFGDDESRRHTVMPIAVGHGTTTQTDAMETRTIKELQIELGAYRYRDLGPSHDATLDVIAFSSNGLKAGSTNKGGIASAFYPAALQLVAGPVFGNAKAGWGFTGGQIKASGTTEVDGEVVSEWSETIDGEGLPEMTTGIGEATLGFRLPDHHAEASATASRAFFPTFDGNLALENRLAGRLAIGVTRWLGTTQRPLAIAVSPFVAGTRTWTRDDGNARDRSYGASLQLGRDLTSLLRVDGIGELGMSPYARIDDGSRAPTSTFGAQLLVALSARHQH